MSEQNRTLRSGPGGGLRCVESGALVELPAGWEFLPSGDATLTRRVKTGGPHWVLEEQQRKRLVSKGVYAPSERITRLQRALEAERATPAYALRLAASRTRRARAEETYAEDFTLAVGDFLAFAPCYAALADALAARVAAHATPVGSGTVARTQRISIERRAEAAVIAWMRHQTTAYDRLVIPRVKGKRREVRRLLAQRSRQLLESYRRGAPVEAEACPLQRALAKGGTRSSPPPQREASDPEAAEVDPSAGAAEPTSANRAPLPLLPPKPVVSVTPLRPAAASLARPSPEAVAKPKPPKRAAQPLWKSGLRRGPRS